MNESTERSHPTSAPDLPHDEVLVELSECSTDDAHAVFSALRTAFACDRAPDDRPQEVTGTRPMVWSATFDVSHGDVPGPPRHLAPADLAAEVTADVQGGYGAVGRMRTALGEAFAVEDVGKVSGDQETQLQMRLHHL
ncbi:hypothetical protein ACWCP6_21110 [Streptomyces sp. NPDC002004]